MPVVSEKQKRLMDAAAHNPSFAKKVGVPVSVAQDFSKASKGAKFGASGTRADSQVVNRPKTNQGKSELFSKGGSMATKKFPPFMGKETKAEEAKEKKVKAVSPMLYKKAEKAEGVHKMAKGGMTPLAKHASKPASVAHKGLKSGGAVDGIASKGKTKGKMVVMNRGGKC